ncbi:MAG TPA: M48 family peptidase [Prosthecochloris aestuarii]|uniref:M48 family peptidase n=1 Tax=Prosthecochloris aestuarii TaxID=1102 RepID=A0A831WS24_PROAE|nr:M48 family peptidase [Prosthecochloris aestuarii]
MDGGRFTYEVRTNRRLTYPRLTMTRAGALIVQVPEGFDISTLGRLVEKKSSWIERARKRLLDRNPGHSDNRIDEPPCRLRLQSIGEEWQIRYVNDPSGDIRLSTSGDVSLLVQGDRENHQGIYHVLCSWLKRKAAIELTPRLEQLASLHSLACSGVSVRHQKTRWGSYSSSGRISLNMKLLFLPGHLVHHVFIHELCHSVHRDHSGKFWRLVEAYDPECMVHRAEMKHASRYIPAFFEYRL